MAETCDGVDNDLDGDVDEALTLTAFRDGDGAAVYSLYRDADGEPGEAMNEGWASKSLDPHGENYRTVRYQGDLSVQLQAGTTYWIVANVFVGSDHAPEAHRFAGAHRRGIAPYPVGGSVVGLTSPASGDVSLFIQVQ